MNLERAARTSYYATIKAGAEGLLRQRWRFGRIFLDPTKPLEDLLHECLVKIAAERTRGREGHWTFDGNRLVSLIEANIALRWIRRMERLGEHT